MLKLTIDYVKERQAFGSRVADFQNTQFKIAEMATEIDLGRTYINSLVEQHLRGEDIVKEVSMAKWWISEMSIYVGKTEIMKTIIAKEVLDD